MGEIIEKAKDLFESTAEQVPEVVSSIVLEGLVGSVVPGVTGAVLAYRQKRQERMYTKFLEELHSRVDELARKLEATENYQEIKSKYFGVVSDYALDEVQEEKIHFIVNGFSNLAAIENLNEDFILTYYDTLQSLRLVDLAALKRFYAVAYEPGQVPHYYDFCKSVGIDDDQYRAVAQKLERMGLVTTRRAEKEDNLYQNMEMIQEYLKSMDKAMKSKNGKVGNLKSFKKIERDTYKISCFGADFVRFFLN